MSMNASTLHIVKEDPRPKDKQRDEAKKFAPPQPGSTQRSNGDTRNA